MAQTVINLPTDDRLMNWRNLKYKVLLICSQSINIIIIIWNFRFGYAIHSFGMRVFIFLPMDKDFIIYLYYSTILI